MISQLPPLPLPPPRPLPPPPPPPPQLAHDHPPAGYTCYDIDTDDHAEQCHGSDSDASATKPESECHHAFNEADTFDASACPDGCVFHASPVMARVIVPHPPDIELRGWLPALSGACRKADGTDEGGVAVQLAPNGKYGRTSGAAPTRMTQAECAAACVAEPTCVGYHHGAWCSIFGRDVHLTPNSQGVRSDKEGGFIRWGPNVYPQENANGDSYFPLNGTQITTIDTTKPNIEYICVRMKLNSDGTRPADLEPRPELRPLLPPSIPDPMAYYFMNEGSGKYLGETMSGDAQAGEVVHYVPHQQNADRGSSAENKYQGPNWQGDDYFGTVIQCGRKTGRLATGGEEQKDTLSLADLDYGHSGRWAMSVWFRDEDINFEGASKQGQFFGHGDPTAYTTARNQLNVQLELDGSVWTGLFDSRDIDRYAGSNETLLVEEFGRAKVDELYPDGVRADCFADRDCRGKFAHSTRTCKTGQRRNVQGRTSADSYRYENSCTRDLYDSQWHHYLVTTRPDGAKGYNVYLDGTLRASSPGIEGVGEVSKADDAINQAVGGERFDPEGRMRFCGRATPGSWAGILDADQAGLPPGAIWREERYFHGKVAHFAIWDDALSERQVNDLHASYVDRFNLRATPVDMPNGVREPLAYYYLDDGHGTELKEAMTGYKGIDHGGGSVIFDPSVENNHGGGETAVDHRPNWVDDDVFGRVIQCGDIRADGDATITQKDTLSLTDVGYGHNGAWSLSVWLRHEPENFPGYSREQFLGHGNPNQYTGHRNQLHIQLEKLDLDANRFGHITTILFDDTDIDRYVGSNETLLRTIYDDAKMAELFPNGVDPDCFADRDAAASSARRPTRGPSWRPTTPSGTISCSRRAPTG